MKSFKLLLLLLAAGLLLQCKKEEAAPKDCAARWKIIKYTGDEAKVENGHLFMSTNRNDAFPVQSYQRGVTGDFEISVDFNNLTNPDLLSQSITSILINDTINGGFFAEASATSNTVFTQCLLQGKADYKYGLLTQVKNGKFKISRTGNSMTVEASSPAISETAKITINVPSTVTGLQIGVMLGASTNKDNQRNSVEFDNFSITNGGGKVKSDQFDCNTVIP